MIRFSACIQAVPERMEHVEQMSIAMMEPSVSPLWFADCAAFYDRDHVGPLFGMQRCIETALAIDSAATHVLMLEDDVSFCRDFLAGVRNAIEARPTLPLHFSYLGKLNTPMPEQSFVHLPGWWGTQAYSLPVDDARRFVEFCKTERSAAVIGAIARAQPGYTPVTADRWALASDVWLRFGLEVLGHPMWHTVPSLAKHNAPTTSTTKFQIAEEEVAIRMSPWFLGSDRSALDVVWDANAVPA